MRPPDRLAAWAQRAARSAGLAGIALGVVLLLTQQEKGYADDWQLRVQLALFAIGSAGALVAWLWQGPGGALEVSAGAGLYLLSTVHDDPATTLIGAALFVLAGVISLALWARSSSRLAVAAVVLPAAAIVIGGGYWANETYDRYLGPRHPGSDLEAPPVHLVEWVWSGAVTSNGATVKAKLADDFESVRLTLSEDPQLTDARYIDAVLGEENIATFEAGGLDADSPYFYAVEADGTLESNRRGRFRTFPEGPASFTFATGADARSGSNGLVFETVLRHEPLFYLLNGDAHYQNIEVNDPDLFFDAYDEFLTRPAQAALYQSTSVAYIWDDHDYGEDDADSTSPTRPAARHAYTAAVPHYPLEAGDGEGDGIYQAFTAGRVRFLVTDARSQRSPVSAPDGPEKTLLGEEQKAWFKRELLAARDDHELIVWVNPIAWIQQPGVNTDGWGFYSTERAELADFITDNQIDNVLILGGDAHMIALDDGTNSAGGMPVFHAAPLDQRGKAIGGPYSHGAYPHSGQFGLVTVEDDGSEMQVTLSGRNYKDEEVVSYEFTVPGD